MSALAQVVPPDGLLPSWNDRPAKQAIIDFVRATVDPSSSGHVRPEDRIAVFDQDGTPYGSNSPCTRKWSTAWRVPSGFAQLAGRRVLVV
jgi:hypothetical protein